MKTLAGMRWGCFTNNNSARPISTTIKGSDGKSVPKDPNCISVENGRIVKNNINIAFGLEKANEINNKAKGSNKGRGEYSPIEHRHDKSTTTPKP